MVTWETTQATTRAGFVALSGRPNVGKSTLVNSIVGAKVSIVSERPQTTRRAVRGVATGRDWQLVLVDLPGVQRPRDVLTERMQRRVEREWDDADVLLLVLDAEAGIGRGDRYLAAQLGAAPVPLLLAVNKVDRLKRPQVVQALKAADDLGVGEEIFPVSARTGWGVGALAQALVARLPEGPFLFPPDERSDQPEAVELAEIIREPILHRMRHEVPHAVEVEVDEVEPDDDLVRVHAYVWTETESQKGIVIGAGGRMIKAIGVAARQALERHLGAHVHLELSVRVRRGWRRDEALLDRLGIE
jgi:GTP-binding protein Era